METSRTSHKGKCVMHFVEDYVVVDIETTGLHPQRNEIIEIGAIRVRNHEVCERFSMMIRPETPVSPFITKLTGITNTMLEREGKEAAYVLSEFLAFVGDDKILGHNVSFDIGFLYEHCYRQLGVFLENDFMDTMRLSRKYLKGKVPNHKLGTLTAYFGYRYVGAHRALADCEFTRLVYNALHEVSLGFR